MAVSLVLDDGNELEIPGFVLADGLEVPPQRFEVNFDPGGAERRGSGSHLSFFDMGGFDTPFPLTLPSPPGSGSARFTIRNFTGFRYTRRFCLGRVFIHWKRR